MQFADRTPRCVIGMGLSALHEPLFVMLKASEPKRVAVGWGNYEAVKASYPGGERVIMPSLSHFAILTRPESHEP